jgi:ATP-binding cassette subfamily C (CFTR/MRP) protein 1
MGILIGEVGVGPALAGMAVLAVIVPIQIQLSGTIGELRRAMVKHTDTRVMLINEILQAIRIIKLYAWEAPMEQRVRQAREDELRQLNSYLNVNGWLREMLFVVQPLAVMAIYLTSLYGYNRPLQQVQVIKVISFLTITRFPLNLLGVALKSIKDGHVSLQRLQRFLLLPGVKSSRDTAGMVPDPCIYINNAVLSWSEVGPPAATTLAKEEIVTKTAGYQPVTAEADTSEGDVEMTQQDTAVDDNSAKGGFVMRIAKFETTRPNELIAVVGSVGSGKSSLLSALLGEVPVRDIVRPVSDAGAAEVTVRGPISYCAQTPWIQNMSLRNNVLFGQVAEEGESPEVHEAYERSLSAASLLPDLRILPDGDETESEFSLQLWYILWYTQLTFLAFLAVGERGINLSGGQKARVSLARAFMSALRTQVFLLDDPFSAVDGATGNWIFEHGVLRLLRDKIRVVALNSHLHLLKYFDRIVILDNGEVVADGSPMELAQQHPDLISRATGVAPSDLCDPANPNPAMLILSTPSPVQDMLAQTSAADPDESADTAQARDAAVQITTAEATTATEATAEATDVAVAEEPTKSKKVAAALIQAERAAVGAVSYGTYVRYFSASLMPRSFLKGGLFYEANDTINFQSWARFLYGFVLISSMFMLFVIVQAARVGVDYVLIRWATQGGSRHSPLSVAYYVIMAVLMGVLLVRCYALNFFAVRSSKNIHLAVFRAVISASVPLFYDTHTIGEVLNRFSKDCETMDVNIPEFILQMLINQLQVLSVFALCVFASPWFALIMFPLGIGFYWMFIYFSAVSRDLKKLESVSRSPIYAALSETLTGLETIRAYGDTKRFFHNYLLRMERNEKFFFHLWMSMSWVTARLELASSVVLLAVALLTVCLRGAVSPIALGLALSYSLQLTALFQRTVQLTIDVTTYMTSTERICEYLKVPQEHSVVPRKPRGHSSDAAEHAGDVETGNGALVEAVPVTNLHNWKPKTGTVEFRDVWLNYRENPPVLKGVSFAVRHGERVGVCGRTGAGKVRTRLRRACI